MLIYHSLNPRALRGCNKAPLPAIVRENRKPWVTQSLFEDWFKSYFCAAVENYYKQNNIVFKFILVLDSAPGHPTVLNGLCENAKVKFLLPKTTCLLQTMDQDIISTVKTYYLRKNFA
jgi:hypothetical protein